MSMRQVDDTGAVIVAAGSGTRFGKATPKQFLPLCRRPVYEWSVRAFRNAGVGHIVVVVPEKYLSRLKNRHAGDGVLFVAGGKERFHSVQAGIALLPSVVTIVAIHDGARPLIDPSLIIESIAAARKYGAAVVAVQSRDTVKLSRTGVRVQRTIARENVWLAQTPQTFRREVIEKAYLTIDPSGITDDAQAVELAGHCVAIVEGNYRNIKITHPLDLSLATVLIRGNN